MEYQSFDGKKIFIHEWTEVDRPKGVVQIIHGMAEHAGRYEKFARFLNGKGYAVVADDHRGHGKTDEATLGYAPGNMFADTVRDEGEITAHYKKKFYGAKYFVFGFSYGSFLTQSYIAKYGERIDGAVIAGSNKKKDFEVYLGSFVVGINNLFGKAKKPSKLVEKLSFGAYAKNFEDGEWVSGDEENNAAYHADLLCDFTCSNRFYADFFKGLKSLYTKKYIKNLPVNLPLLIASGTDDPVGDMGRGVKKLYEFYTQKAGMQDVTLALFEGCRHEFLNEKKGQEERYKAIARFFDEH